jgi:hypothetical protein
MPSPETTDDRIQRMEWTLYGLTGNNGLVGEMKQLRRELNDWREEDRQRRERERETELEDRKKDRRWRLGFAVSVVIAILTASAIIAQAL